MVIYNCRWLGWFGIAGMAIYPFILVRWGKEFEDHPKTKCLLAHERVHHKQQLKYFLVGFLFLYLFSKQHRYRFEVEAYAVSYLNGRDLYNIGDVLSGALYGNCVTKQQAMLDVYTESKRLLNADIQ